MLRETDEIPGGEAALLPAPAASSHAPFLFETRDGTLLCAWFSGSREGRPDVAIYCSRLEPRTHAWSRPVRVTPDERRSEQNPVIYENSAAELVILNTSQDLSHQDTAFVRMQISKDDGRTWSSSKVLFDEPGIFIRQPVVRHEGRLILPVYYCRGVNGTPWRKRPGDNDVSGLKISEDEGATWKTETLPASVGAVQMNVLPFADTLVAIFRDRYAERVKLSVMGRDRSWSDPAHTDLPSNNSSMQAIAADGGALIAVYNDAATTLPPTFDDAGVRRAVWGTDRFPLSLARSVNGGRNWTKLRDLATIDARPVAIAKLQSLGGSPELSYPAIALTRDGSLNIAFTHLRKAIRHFRFPAASVL